MGTGKTRNEILSELEKIGVMDNIIRNITKTDPKRDDTIKDLKQMVYMALLEKPEELVVDLYGKGQLIYYISRIAMNQWNSKTSPFYYTYRKLMNNSIDIDDYGEEPTGEWD